MVIFFHHYYLCTTFVISRLYVVLLYTYLSKIISAIFLWQIT